MAARSYKRLEDLGETRLKDDLPKRTNIKSFKDLEEKYTVKKTDISTNDELEILTIGDKVLIVTFYRNIKNYQLKMVLEKVLNTPDLEELIIDYNSLVDRLDRANIYTKKAKTAIRLMYDDEKYFFMVLYGIILKYNKRLKYLNISVKNGAHDEINIAGISEILRSKDHPFFQVLEYSTSFLANLQDIEKLAKAVEYNETLQSLTLLCSSMDGPETINENILSVFRPVLQKNKILRRLCLYWTYPLEYEIKRIKEIEKFEEIEEYEERTGKKFNKKNVIFEYDDIMSEHANTMVKNITLMSKDIAKNSTILEFDYLDKGFFDEILKNKNDLLRSVFGETHTKSTKDRLFDLHKAIAEKLKQNKSKYIRSKPSGKKNDFCMTIEMMKRAQRIEMDKALNFYHFYQKLIENGGYIVIQQPSSSSDK